VSGGRAVLGIGRGDSALTHLGFGPAPVGTFSGYLERVQAYLRGEAVPFDVERDGGGHVASSETLGLARRPSASRLLWLDPATPKVPVDVAASGPRTIGVGARLAERVTLAVGVSPQRIRWAMEVAAEARARAGLAGPGPAFGTYVPILVHPDRAEARQLLAGMAASVSRFSVMHGTAAGPLDEREAGILQQVHDTYDFDQHFTRGSPQSRSLDDAMIDAWSIAGPPAYCVERLTELSELGLGKVFVLDGGWGIDPDVTRASRRSLAEDVIPACR
jgi:5,10-methylenetetrahydromethanopterin reductase